MSIGQYCVRSQDDASFHALEPTFQPIRDEISRSSEEALGNAVLPKDRISQHRCSELYASVTSKFTVFWNRSYRLITHSSARTTF